MRRKLGYRCPKLSLHLFHTYVRHLLPTRRYIVSLGLGVTLSRCVCVRRAAYITYRLHTALVSAAKVTRCIQHSSCSCISGRPCVPQSFSSTRDKHVRGGTANEAGTAESCQAACVQDSGCVGLDWSPTSSPGELCWLISTAGDLRDLAGVTHYDLTRNANCGR